MAGRFWAARRESPTRPSAAPRPEATSDVLEVGGANSARSTGLSSQARCDKLPRAALSRVSSAPKELGPVQANRRLTAFPVRLIFATTASDPLTGGWVLTRLIKH